MCLSFVFRCVFDCVVPVGRLDRPFPTIIIGNNSKYLHHVFDVVYKRLLSKIGSDQFAGLLKADCREELPTIDIRKRNTWNDCQH